MTIEERIIAIENATREYVVSEELIEEVSGVDVPVHFPGSSGGLANNLLSNLYAKKDGVVRIVGDFTTPSGSSTYVGLRVGYVENPEYFVGENTSVRSISFNITVPVRKYRRIPVTLLGRQTGSNPYNGTCSYSIKIYGTAV